MSRRQARQVEFDRDALQAARLRAGLSQENLARLVGVTVRTTWRWERGGGEPNGTKLIALADVLNVAPDDLFRELPEEAAA
jgi:transcriptional regulator with XRE-family HTH domain